MKLYAAQLKIMLKSLDTNILLRILLQDVPLQLDKIKVLFRDSRPGSLLVEDAVFFECVWILSGEMNNFSREEIGSLILKITSLRQVNCNKAMLEIAIPNYAKYSTISFIDACLAAYAELNNATPLLTFDKKLTAALPKSVNVL